MPKKPKQGDVRKDDRGLPPVTNVPKPPPMSPPKKPSQE